MKKEFIDECKDRVFDALLGQKGQAFDSRYDLEDQISYLIGDDIIFYSEGPEALKAYPDEFEDYWDEEGYIYKEMETFNPFKSEGLLAVWRGMVSDSCRFIMEEIAEGFGEEPVVLEKETLLSLSKKLDGFVKYPFSESCYAGGYPYEPEERSYYQEAKEYLSEKKQKGLKL